MGKDNNMNNTLCCIIYIKTMFIEVSCWVTLLHAFSCGGDTADTELKVPAAENSELLNFLSSSPGVGQNIVFHASVTAVLISAFSVLSTSFFFPKSFPSRTFSYSDSKADVQLLFDFYVSP